MATISQLQQSSNILQMKYSQMHKRQNRISNNLNLIYNAKHKICNKAVTLETKQQRAAKLDAGQQYSSYEILKQSEVLARTETRKANKVVYNFCCVCPK